MKRILLTAMAVLAFAATAASYSAGSAPKTIPPPLCPPFCR